MTTVLFKGRQEGFTITTLKTEAYTFDYVLYVDKKGILCYQVFGEPDTSCLQEIIDIFKMKINRRIKELNLA